MVVFRWYLSINTSWKPAVCFIRKSDQFCIDSCKNTSVKKPPIVFFISYFIDGPWSILLWSLFYRPIQTHNGRCMWILIYQSIAFFKSYKIVYFLYSENLGQFRNLKGTILETWFCAFLTTIELISVKTVGFDSKQIIYLESASKTESICMTFRIF